MSFNTVEDFNSEMSSMVQENTFVCADRQYVFVNDYNQQNYNTGYVQFNNVNLVGSDSKKVLDMNNGFLVLPYGCVASLSTIAAQSVSFGILTAAGPPAVYTVSPNNVAMIAPKGNHHLLDQIYLKFGGQVINQGNPYLNFYVNEKLKTYNSDQQRQIADFLGVSWDTPESYTYNAAVLETNNTITNAYNSSWDNGIKPTSFANMGHVNRILKSNTDFSHPSVLQALNGNTSVFSDVYQTGLIGGVDSTGALVQLNANGVLTSANPITSLMFQYLAIIPLSVISDFFNKMASINVLNNFEMRLLTNLSPNNSWSIQYGALAGSTFSIASVSQTQSVGNTCPFLVSTAYSGGVANAAAPGTSTGFNIYQSAAAAIPRLTITPYIGYYTSVPAGVTTRLANNSSLVPAQIYIPSVILTDTYLERMLDTKEQTILYNDYTYDASIINVAPFSNINKLLQFQTSRLRTLYILPYYNPTGVATSTDVRRSLLSSAPNTVSYGKVSNLQVYLGSVNLFVQPQSYDFLHFMNGSWVKQNIMNGGDFRGTNPFGQVNFTNYKKCYNVYVVDLERVSDEVSDEIIKNIQITFKNDCNMAMDYLIITEFQQQCTLDRISGQLVVANTISANNR